MPWLARPAPFDRRAFSHAVASGAPASFRRLWEGRSTSDETWTCIRSAPPSVRYLATARWCVLNAEVTAKAAATERSAIGPEPRDPAAHHSAKHARRHCGVRPHGAHIRRRSRELRGGRRARRSAALTPRRSRLIGHACIYPPHCTSIQFDSLLSSDSTCAALPFESLGADGVAAARCASSVAGRDVPAPWASHSARIADRGWRIPRPQR